MSAPHPMLQRLHSLKSTLDGGQLQSSNPLKRLRTDVVNSVSDATSLDQDKSREKVSQLLKQDHEFEVSDILSRIQNTHEPLMNPEDKLKIDQPTHIYHAPIANCNTLQHTDMDKPFTPPTYDPSQDYLSLYLQMYMNNKHLLNIFGDTLNQRNYTLEELFKN